MKTINWNNVLNYAIMMGVTILVSSCVAIGSASHQKKRTEAKLTKKADGIMYKMEWDNHDWVVLMKNDEILGLSHSPDCVCIAILGFNNL